MNIQRLIHTGLILLLLALPLQAQELVLTNLSPNFGPVTADHFTMVSVTNPGTLEVRGSLVTTLTDIDGAVVAELRSYTLSLAAGQNLVSVSINWPRRITYGASRSSSGFARTGVLGFGEFNLCTVFQDQQGEIRGTTCLERKSVPMLQFSLVFPLDESIIQDERPVLSWEDVGRYGVETRNLTYSIELVEVLAGQSVPEALETNIPLLSRQRLRSSSLLYPVSAKPLRRGKNYAWTVAAYADDQELIGSQQWSFYLDEEANEEEITVAKSYAMLAPRIVNRQYIFTDAIQLGFDNNEGVKILDYRIINLSEGGKELKALPVLEDLTPGLNTLDIATKGLGLDADNLYQLEVSTPRGQRYYLQFLIKS